MKTQWGIAICLICFVLGGCASAPHAIPRQAVVQPRPAPEPQDPLEAGFQELADQIVAGLRSKQASQIAVVQFQDLDGRVSEFGGFLAEEMITRLYQTGMFRVVEREMLNRVMAEHELATSGLVDESTAKKLGKLLGVDAIATGTITGLGNTVRVNSRLIATETGSVFSAAAVTFPKDERVATLMQQYLTTPTGPQKTNHGTKKNSPTTSAGVIYSEDFKDTAEGLLPETWIGGTHLHVHPNPTRKGGNVLSPFEKGPYQFTIPDLPFPENWKMTVNFQLDRWKDRCVQVWQIGDLKLQMRSTKGAFRSTAYSYKLTKSQPARMEITKEGPVFKFYLDSQKLAVIRVPGFERPQGITVSDNCHFTLHSIKVEALP